MEASLETNPAATEAEMKDLSDKLEHMENRQDTLRFVGVPEGKESRDMMVFMQKLLTLVLDWDESVQPPEIDWSHRAPIPQPKPGE